MFLLEDEEKEDMESMFDESITISRSRGYGLLSIDSDVPRNENMFCVSSDSPKKACPELKDAIWVRRGGDNSPDSMRMEVLYEVERHLSSGKDVILYNLDGLFLGWKPLKIYTYLKLLVDLGEKFGTRIHVSGKMSREEIKKLALMFS